VDGKKSKNSHRLKGKKKKKACPRPIPLRSCGGVVTGGKGGEGPRAVPKTRKNKKEKKMQEKT